MFKRDWGNGLASGIILGGGTTAVLFLFGQAIYDLAKCNHDGQCDRYAAQYEGEDLPSTWWWFWDGSIVSASDTLAQWIMAFFTIAVVLLVWRTLVATQVIAGETTRIGEAPRVRTVCHVSRFSVGPLWAGCSTHAKALQNKSKVVSCRRPLDVLRTAWHWLD